MPLPPTADMAATPHAAPERAIVRHINRERAIYGLPRLKSSRRLARVAEGHSIDQLRFDRLSHDSSDGTPFDRRIRRVTRKRHIGENLAFAPRGSSSRARAIVRLWMQSPSHRAIVLDRKLRRVGVGKEFGRIGAARGFVVTVDFAS